MEPEAFTLQDLATHTGVEPRTIRRYVEKGILPGPESLGRGARYTRDTLDRLRVFLLIRDTFRDVSVDQARLHLQALTPAQIRNLAAGKGKVATLLGPQNSAVKEQHKGDALAYLRGLKPSSEHALFSRTPGKESAGTFPPKHTDPTDQQPLLEQASRALATLAGLASSGRGLRGENWYRIRLTQDIELSVRGEFAPDQLAQFHRIGDALRTLLTKGTPK